MGKEDVKCNEASQPVSEQFDRSEEAATLPTNKLRHPKGVFRFRTFEEFNKWKDKYGCDKGPQELTLIVDHLPL